MSLLQGKRGVVLGVANKRSLAWSIAERAAEQGAGLAITCQSERFERRVGKMIDESEHIEEALLLPCDATSGEEMDALFSEVGSCMGELDFIVHGWAYAPREDMSHDYVHTTWDGHRTAQQVSAHSLTEIARRGRELMTGGGSILTLSYFGAEKVVPGYNVMGVAKASLEAAVRYLARDLGGENIRVNAISAAPVNTLSARGVPGFLDMLTLHEERAPLQRNVDPDEIARAAVFMLSSWSSAVTGEILHVDAGYNIMGM